MILEVGILDPTTGDSWGTWTVTAGQGTGVLAHASGSGTSDTRTSDMSTGTIRCS